MYNTRRENNLLVIASGVPGDKTGYEMALFTSLAAYCEVFDNIHYISLRPGVQTPKLSANAVNVNFHHVEVPQRSIRSRFLRSLTGKTPACVLRFTTGSLMKQLRSTLASMSSNGFTPTHVIYEDIPVAYLAASIQDLHPDIKSAIRSHNVLQNCFRGMEHTGGVIEKSAWHWELSRIRRFENALIHSIPTLWSITEEDMHDYQRLYGCNVDGVFGVGIDTSRYRHVSPGEDHVVLHIGNLDARRSPSMRYFLETEWSKVRAQVPEARLLLAGKNSEQFTEQSLGVVGCGEVASDVQFLSRGRVFINTQEVGSGVKLKSLVAMAAGKALVSTANGVLGIPAAHETHLLKTDTVCGMAEHIVPLLLRRNVTDNLAKAAQALVAEHYGLDLVARRTIPLLAAWKSSGPKNSHEHDNLEELGERRCSEIRLY